MSNPDDKTQVETPPNATETVLRPLEPDVENQQQQTPPPPTTETGTSGSGFDVSSLILKRWKRDDLMKKGCMILRILGFLFSLLAFVIMVTNKHGNHDDWRHFDKYEELRYVLAAAILSTLYTGFQALRIIHEVSKGKPLFQIEKQTSALLDFVLDQVMAYLLISALSSAIPLTNKMRQGADNIFTDAIAASISMEFFAFSTLACSALVSGHKLITQSYI